jgi:hypothetical protein
MQARAAGQWVDVGENEDDRDVTSTPIGEDDVVIAQENLAGKDNIRGGGEFPDPDTPPDEGLGAPGADLDEVRSRDDAS